MDHMLNKKSMQNLGPKFSEQLHWEHLYTAWIIIIDTLEQKQFHTGEGGLEYVLISSLPMVK